MSLSSGHSVCLCQVKKWMTCRLKVKRSRGKHLVCVCVHKYRDWKIYAQANSFQKPSNGKILHKDDGYVKSLSPIEMTPKIQCQSKRKPHLIIWKILRNPQGEQRCTTSTLGGNSVAGKGTEHSHLGNFVTPHNLSAAQRAKPTCGSQPQMPRWER